MVEYLGKYRLLRPHPTHSNFILCDVLGADAAALQAFAVSFMDR